MTRELRVTQRMSQWLRTLDQPIARPRMDSEVPCASLGSHELGGDVLYEIDSERMGEAINMALLGSAMLMWLADYKHATPTECGSAV